MAKILRQGTLPEEKTYDLTCSKCSTLARFTGDEKKYAPGRYNESYWEFKCPYCQAVISINSNKIAEYESVKFADQIS